MEIIITGTHVDLTPSLKQYVHDKIGTLLEETLDNRVTKAAVELEIITKHHQKGDIFRAEAMISVPRHTIRAEATSEEMHAAIDLLVPKLRMQIEKHKAKLSSRFLRQARKFARILKSGQ